MQRLLSQKGKTHWAVKKNLVEKYDELSYHNNLKCFWKPKGFHGSKISASQFALTDLIHIIFVLLKHAKIHILIESGSA